MSEYNETYERVYFVNYTDNYVQEDMSTYQTFFNNVHTYTAAVGYILSTLVIIVNLGIIIACNCTSQIKSDIFYLQIVNFSISNILIGVFVIPLTVYSILFPWTIGETTCKLWIISDVLLPFSSILILVLLNIDRLLILTYPKVYACLFQKCLKQIILVTPWMMSFVIVVPLWTHGALPHDVLPGECVIMLSHAVALACTIATFFVPLICIIFLALKIVCVKMRSYGDYMLTTEDSIPLNMSAVTSSDSHTFEQNELNATVSEEPDSVCAKSVSKQSIVSIVLADIVYFSMWLPYQSISLSMNVCTTHICMQSPVIIQTVTWLATASSAVVPCVWLVDTNINQFCCSKKSRNRLTIDEVNI